MSNKTIILCDKNGKALKPFNDSLFSGYMYDEQIEIRSINPGVTWNGPKIPYELWQKIVSFMRWSQVTTKSEAHLALFYDTIGHRWGAWAFPQSGVGMTVKTLPDHPLYAEDRKQFGKGWIMAGSVHHHCEGAAFQSGTDKNDEETKEGVHITIGKTTSAEIDTHTRVVWGETMFTVSISDWVDVPDVVSKIPSKYRDKLTKEYILSPEEGEFPPVWKERIIKEEKKPAHFYGPLERIHTNINRPWMQRTQTGGTPTTATATTSQDSTVADCRKFLKFLSQTEHISGQKMSDLLNMEPLDIVRLNDIENLVLTRINNAITTSKYDFGLCLAVLENMLLEDKQTVMSL